MAYGCFVVDAFSRMIVGWRVATNMSTATVLGALGMARWQRSTGREGLVARCDVGTRCTSLAYGECEAKLGAVAYIGSIGDSFGTPQTKWVLAHEHGPLQSDSGWARLKRTLLRKREFHER